MKVIISNRSGVPIYEQIKIQIKEAIFNGELVANDVLPSIRSLAQDLKVSVITTTRAYSDLEKEGFVVNVQGKGCYVLPQDKELMRETALLKIEESLTGIIQTARLAKIKKIEILEVFTLLCEEDKYE